MKRPALGNMVTQEATWSWTQALGKGLETWLECPGCS